jgi:hypothetical protein
MSPRLFHPKKIQKETKRVMVGGTITKSPQLIQKSVRIIQKYSQKYKKSVKFDKTSPETYRRLIHIESLTTYDHI